MTTNRTVHHYHNYRAGLAAYTNGEQRIVPRGILVDEGADAARVWYRGWDRANVLAHAVWSETLGQWVTVPDDDE